MRKLKASVLVLFTFSIIVSVQWITNTGLKESIAGKNVSEKRLMGVKVYSNESLPDYKDVGLHLLIPLILPGNLDPMIGDNLRVHKESPEEVQSMLRRDEIMECLSRNLDNPMVATITVFYVDTKLPEYIDLLQLDNIHKLNFFNQSQDPTLKVIFGYVSKHLINKVVMLINQDVVLDPISSRKIDLSKFLTVNMMYALTRTLPPNPCKEIVGHAHCNMEYRQSHDGFIFCWKQSVSQEFLDEFDFTQSTPSEEAEVIWNFRFRLKFKVLNPCKSIFLYHYHCFSLRTGRARIGKSIAGKHYLLDSKAFYTTDLW